MSEHDDQVALFQWREFAMIQQPELALLFAIPNGGLRNKAVAAQLKAEGVEAGVPDMCLPVPRGRYHGLFLELKTESGRVSKEQKWWITQLKVRGYRVEVCRGWGKAVNALNEYLAPVDHVKDVSA